MRSVDTFKNINNITHLVMFSDTIFHKKTMEAVIMKKIKIEFTNERLIPASGLAVVGAILGKSDFVKRCNRMDVTPNRSQHQIKNGDVLLTYIGLLTRCV